MRKAFIFSLDALLAALLIVGGLLLVTQITNPDTDSHQLNTASQDLVRVLDNIELHELKDPWVQGLLRPGNDTDGNLTVLEELGRMWAIGNTADAQKLASIVLGGVYQDMGLRLSIDGDELYYRASPKKGDEIVASTRMLTGVAEGEAITGSSASAYLKRIKDKRTGSFTVFGGFIGQGNISMRFADLPSDANITSVLLELAAFDDFNLYFNSVQCGATYTPTYANGTPDLWDLRLCNASLVPGTTNIMSINFTGDLNESYVAGGFLNVKYLTDELLTNFSDTFLQYRFPGVRGIANLFDSFYVPGQLKNMTVYLHYNVSNSTYLQIGDKKVWEDDANNTEKIVILNNSYLINASQGKLVYDQLSNTTVPIRFAGFEPNATVVTSGDADVVLITDFSGSMKKQVAGWSQGNLGSNCDDAYEDNNTRRTNLATCVDDIFVANIMNYSGNRIWPVFLHSNEVKWYNNPEDESAISGYINSYSNGKDKTCYACALNQAYDIFNTLSSPDRQKFILFMTDGVPTHCTDEGCMGNSTVYGTEQCEGLCDFQGNCDASQVANYCSDCTTNDGGVTNAIYAANRSVVKFNATIFTVGFGAVDDCTLAEYTLETIANISNGTYQQSNDSSKLKLIYENISKEILTRTNLEAQVAVVQGENTRSEIFDDSYINLTFEQAIQYQPKQNMISITLQTPDACNPVLSLYPEQEIIEAKAVSYSGVYWTDVLKINSITVFNLSNYFKPYTELGDPTLVYTPISVLQQGDNIFDIQTGKTKTNRTGCSVNNSVIYTVQINLSTERSIVVPDLDGCEWAVEFVDGTLDNLTIPSSYVGANKCSYRPGNITYDANDAYQLGAYQLLERLDFSKEGKLYVNLEEEDLEIVVTTISGIPYMWGPAMATIEVIR